MFKKKIPGTSKDFVGVVSPGRKRDESWGEREPRGREERRPRRGEGDRDSPAADGGIYADTTQKGGA